MAESIIILLYRTLLIQHLNYMWETCLEISEIWFSYPLKGVKKTHEKYYATNKHSTLATRFKPIVFISVTG